MKSLRFLDRRAGYSLASLGLLLGMVVPAVLPAFASAALVTSRSIELSSSAANQANVTYKLTFTPSTSEASAGIVLFFCNDSPIPGQTCTTPSGFDASNAAMGAGSEASSTIAAKAAGKIQITDSTTGLTSGTPATFVLTGIHNPTLETDATAGHGLYARIQTYASVANAGTAYTNGAGDTTNVIDDGGVAMSITTSIGVSAIVKESMTFCVAGAVTMNANGPSGTCGTDANGGAATGLDTGDITLSLGHGSPKAIDSTATDTGSDWAQISTNASGGALVRMTNTNPGNCNGLFRTGGTVGTCDIPGVGDTAAGIPQGTALFGMLLGTPVSAPFSTTGVPTGTITPSTLYNGTSTHYGMGSNTTASPYGDTIFTTGGQPIADQNVKLTFAASASPATPAGIYTATMNLIATGTF